MKQPKILLVDDELDILEFVSYNLRKEGFIVLVAENGKKAIEIAIKEIPDIIILDVMMPEMDGIETCHELKEIPSLSNTLIIFLSARGEDYTQIAGFDAGGDDYITKPIKPKLLISRIQAILKRKKTDFTKINIVDEGGIKIDREKYVVIQDSIEKYLPKKEFELIALLMSKPGRVLTREHILDSIWGEGVEVGDRTIDVHIRKIREKLGNDVIKTIKGVGYKFQK